MPTVKQLQRAYVKQNMPKVLSIIPEEKWPNSNPDPKRFEVWADQEFLVQLFREQGGIVRISVCRTTLAKGAMRWKADITWDELQAIKDRIGYKDKWAVELFPSKDHIVDVANMRHLWVLPEAPNFGWRIL